MVVRLLPQSVVAPKAVDVTGESGIIRAGELLCSRANDGFYLSVDVWVHVFQVALSEVVSKKPDSPARRSECFPRRLEYSGNDWYEWKQFLTSSGQP